MVQPIRPVNYELRWLASESSSRLHIGAILRRVKQEFTVTGCDVLELGSGIGTNLRVFIDDNRVQGLDGLPDAAAHATRTGVATSCADLEAALPLPSSSVDWILCIDVLEHLVQPERCLGEAIRVLRPHGRVLINVPNHFDWRGRLRILLGSGIDSQRYFPQRPAWRYPHLRFFSRADLTSLLDVAGLSVERDYSSHTSSIPKATLLSRLGFGVPISALSRAAPDLLQAGFFVVCRRSTEC